MKEPRAGEKLSEQEAKEYVDSLYKALYKYAHEKIYQGAFMTQLRDGKLPVSFEVVYGHAWKAAPRHTEDGRAIVKFERHR